MDKNPFKSPGAKPFQFRLLTLFAVIALIGWGIVVVPHWIKVYPKQRLEQKQRDYEVNRLDIASRESRKERLERELERRNEAYETARYGNRKHAKPEDVDIMPFVMVVASIVAMLAALFAVLWLNDRPRSVPKE